MAKGTRAWIKSSSTSTTSQYRVAKEYSTNIVHLGGSRMGDSWESPIDERRCGVIQWPTRSTVEAPEEVGVLACQTEPLEQVFSPWTDSTPDLSPLAAPPSVRSDTLPSGSDLYPLSATSTAFSKPRSPPAPPSSSSSSYSPSPLRSLRRSQSVAEIQNRSQADTFEHHEVQRSSSKWKALPSRPNHSADSTDSLHASIVQQRRPTLSIFPASKSPAPKGPVPSKPTERKPSKNDPSKHSPTEAPSSQKRLSRFTPQERLWLHRHYRGEALFLKSWGLNIDKDEDRDEGMMLMRELIQSDEERKSSKRGQKESNHGLQIIIEEEKRNMNSPLTQDPERLAIPHGDMRSPEEHMRMESEKSVLGAYLDAGMNRID